MSNINPTGSGGYIPPESNKVEGKKGQAGPQPQNTLQAEILQIQALLQNGDKTGAVNEINTVLNQLGPGTLQNAARNELLAAKSAIVGGAPFSVINTHLNAAFNLLGK